MMRPLQSGDARPLELGDIINDDKQSHHDTKTEEFLSYQLASSDSDHKIDLSDARELVASIVSTDDDPSLNPWTFRTLVIGIGLSTFGGVLGWCPFISGE